MVSKSKFKFGHLRLFPRVGSMDLLFDSDIMNFL